MDAVVLDRSFRKRLYPFAGRTVEVWTTRIDRPYVRGILGRTTSVGMIVGSTAVHYCEVDALECEGERFGYLDGVAAMRES
jgi:hypothetical protein